MIVRYLKIGLGSLVLLGLFAGLLLRYQASKDRQEYYYLLETLTYPAPTLILNQQGELVRSFDAILSAIDPTFGIAIASTHHDLSYYDIQGKLRFQFNTAKNIHHSITINPRNGDLYIIANQVKDYFGTPALIDSIERYSKEGKLLATFDGLEQHDKLFKLFSSFIPRKYQALGRLPLNPFGYEPWGSSRELFHFNYLQSIPKNLYSGKIEGFEEGNILLTMPYYGSFLLLDSETLEIRWRKSFALDHLPLVEKSWMMTEDYVTGFIIHSGTVQQDGNIVYFRNQDFLRTMNCDLRQAPNPACTDDERQIFHGAAIGYNPSIDQQDWIVPSTEKLNLDTLIQGSAFLNVRGNVVVTNSDQAKFYEVDQRGNILFEFDLAKLFTPSEKSRIYKTLEIPKKLLDPFLHSMR